MIACSLDLGTGTGFVVEALKQSFDHIIAVDPDTDLLAAARHDVRPTDGQRITWVEARAEEFGPPTDWHANLITISRAFHWMDGETVLQAIDGYAARATSRRRR